MAGFSHSGAQRRGQGRERGKGNNNGAHNRSRSPHKGAKNRAGHKPAQKPGRMRADAPRHVALQALTAVRREDAYANLILPGLITQAGLTGRDAAFTTALTYGTLRLQGRYDAILDACTDRRLNTLDGVVLDVLRLGTHQILGMRVAVHGAVHASVDLARDAAGQGSAGFVNAVLRRVSERSLEAWLDHLNATAADSTEALALTGSHPLWIVKAMRQALTMNGREASELGALIDADNEDPAVALCARPGLVSPEHLIKEISKGPQASTKQTHPARQDAAKHTEDHGESQDHSRGSVDAELGRISPYGVLLHGGDPGRLPSVRQGKAGVEDEGSQLVALLLAQAPIQGRDERWLDMCAGPGGKTALLGARAAQRGAHLDANEISNHRTDMVRENVRALPYGTVKIRRGDGRDYAAQAGHYDRILVDAPCSGLGSLRRRPEARWRKTAADAAALADLQRELLMSALQAVRPGGVVAYVTCSPHVVETHFVVRDALKKLGGQGIEAELIDAGDLATRIAPVPPAGAREKMLQLWPHLDGTDAMFCALLRRTL